MANLKKHWVGCSIGAGLVTSFGLVCFLSAVGDGATRWSCDLPFAWRSINVPEQAAIVYLDEASHSDLEQPFDRPWDRSLHARLLQQLQAAGARAVVFDILFSDPGPNAAIDKKFADAIKAFGKVVLCADYVQTPHPGQRKPAESLYLPLEIFRQAGADWGLDSLWLDSDFAVRRHTPAR